MLPPTDCRDDAGDLRVPVAAGSSERLERPVSQEQALLVLVRVRQYEPRILLLRDRHVEADVGRFHDVPRTGIQLNRRVWNVLFNADQCYTVSAAPTTKLWEMDRPKYFLRNILYQNAHCFALAFNTL